MKKVIEQILRKVRGEVLGADSLAGILKGVVEKVVSENQDWVKAIAAKVKAISDEQKAEADKEEAADDTQAPKSGTGEPALSWCYGGFDGSKAKVADDAVLASATLKGDTLSFSWERGGCEQLGATSKSDANHSVACLFLANGKGGKFEWISTSRKTRNMKNIKEGYNGWPKGALDKGGKLYFCIAGVKDDQKTSNGKRTALVEVSRG